MFLAAVADSIIATDAATASDAADTVVVFVGDGVGVNIVVVCGGSGVCGGGVVVSAGGAVSSASVAASAAAVPAAAVSVVCFFLFSLFCLVMNHYCD